MCASLPDGTRISNPQNCQSYFECQNGRRREISCPVSMSFDANSNQCRDASSVNCINNNGNEICRGQKNGNRFHNPLNCAEYFECQNNQRIEKTCNAGQLYNTQLSACVSNSNVNCGTRRIPNTHQNNHQDGIINPCQQSGTYIRAHPLPCQSTYFICIDGNMIQHTCANGIVFNSDTLQCDFAQNSGCDVIRLPQIPRAVNCSSGQSFYPHLTNCNQYYLCIHETPQIMTCPNGQIWMNNRGRCETPTASSQCNGRIALL